MKEAKFFRKGNVIRGPQGDEVFKSANKAKRKSREIQMAAPHSPTGNARMSLVASSARRHKTFAASVPSPPVTADICATRIASACGAGSNNGSHGFQSRPGRAGFTTTRKGNASH